MKSRKFLPILLVTYACAWTAPVKADLLTFDDFEAQFATRAVGQSYTGGGYEIRGSGPSHFPNAEFYVLGEGRSEWTGSPGLTLFVVGGRIELRSMDDSLFDLESIDIARGDTNRGLIPIGFVGYRADGSTVQATYRFSDDIAGRNETFVFGVDFTGLSSLVWYQGAEWHQFDNIRLTSSAVPEPGSASLCLIGLFAATLVHRRKHRTRLGSLNAV